MNHFSRIKDKLGSYGIDAMLLTEEYNRFYAVDFHSSGTDAVAVVTKDKNYYFTDSRYTVAAQAAVKDAEISITGSGRGYIELINRVIEEHGIKNMGFDDAYMTVGAYEGYKSKLSCSLVPASEMMADIRVSKDEEEIARLISAQRIAEKALTDTLDFIRPGLTEREVAAFLQYRMLVHGGEKNSFDPIVVSGINTTMPHGQPGDRVIREGDFVTMDFGCVKDGYCSDMTRTVAVGYATEEMEKVYNVVLLAQTTAIAETRAGRTGKEIDSIAREIIARAGYGDYFGHGYGHGVGVEIHETPTVSPRNDKPLPTGAVTSAEPGIYIPGKFGVRIEDVVIIRDGGCEDITLAPKELLVL